MGRSKKYITISCIILFAIILQDSCYGQFGRWTMRGIEKRMDFISFNFLRNGEIADVINGPRLGVSSIDEPVMKTILNDITNMPLWKNSPKLNRTGAELTLFYNPFSVEFGAMSATLDLEQVDKYFALPPSRPTENRGSTIDILNFYAGVSYVPFALFYGYVYPSVGAIFYMANYEYEGNTETYLTSGLTVEISAKYNWFFVSWSYRKFFENTESFDDQTKLQAGLWMTF